MADQTLLERLKLLRTEGLASSLEDVVTGKTVDAVILRDDLLEEVITALENPTPVSKTYFKGSEAERMSSESATLQKLMPPPREIVSFDTLIHWLENIKTGFWRWSANSKCKYVKIYLDTRSGAYAILDRDDNKLTEHDLLWQYSQRIPRPPTLEEMPKSYHAYKDTLRRMIRSIEVDKYRDDWIPALQYAKELLEGPMVDHNLAMVPLDTDFAGAASFYAAQKFGKSKDAIIADLKTRYNANDDLDALVYVMMRQRAIHNPMTESDIEEIVAERVQVSPTFKDRFAQYVTPTAAPTTTPLCTCLSEIAHDAYGPGGPSSGQPLPPPCEIHKHN